MAAGLAIFLIVAALLTGLALGWLIVGRGAGEAARLLRLQLDGVRDERDLARGEIGPIRDARDRALLDLAARDSAAGERERGFEAQLAALREARDALSAQFSEVGAKLLGDAQTAFLQRANERFAEAGNANEAKLKALLTPVETTLKRYEEGLQKVEKERVDSYAGLREAVGQLTQGNETVRRETARLTNVLRSSPKHRGRWGEEQLRTILESAGLGENVDFTLQSTVTDGERQLRPDCVINLPGGRCIVVDVKCPLVHFEAAFDEEDEDRRTTLLLQHAGAMRDYSRGLGRKGYWKQFDRSPDFVIMFIPGEHFLSAAAERAPDLIEAAFREGVIIASTINMLALAKVMAGMWRQETVAQQAREIGELGKKLHAGLAKMGSFVVQLGKRIEGVNASFNGMIGSLEGNVWVQARKFEALDFLPGENKLEDLGPVEATARPLMKLSATETAD